MTISIYRKYEIEAAHQLTGGLPDNHRCRREHGHRYEVELGVIGSLDLNGVLIEYGELDLVVMPILRLADHHSLNTLHERCSTPEAVQVSSNPTVERLAVWLRFRLRVLESTRPDQNLRISHLRVSEDSKSGAIWVG